MSDTSHRAPDTSATDVGAAPVKLFKGARALVARIDVADADQVFDLAFLLQDAPRRRLMQATHAELRAIARLAVRAGVIASNAVALSALAPDSEAFKAQLKTLSDLVKTP